MDHGQIGVHGVIVIRHVEVELQLGLKSAIILPHQEEDLFVWDRVKNLKLAMRRHVPRVSA